MSQSSAPHAVSYLQGPVSRRGFIKASLVTVLAWLAGGMLQRRGSAAAAPQPDGPPPGDPDGAGKAAQTGGLLGAPPLLERFPAPPGIPLDRLTYSVCSQHVGEVFRIHPPAAKWIDVELVQAIDLTSRYLRLQVAEGLPVSGECFSLLFRGPRNRLLAQDTYRVAHDSVGEFELLIVPLLPDHDALYYEALFNRLVPVM